MNVRPIRAAATHSRCVSTLQDHSSALLALVACKDQDKPTAQISMNAPLSMEAVTLCRSAPTCLPTSHVGLALLDIQAQDLMVVTALTSVPRILEITSVSKLT